MSALLIGCCAVLGLVIGSFLNVVIWRVPRDESVIRPPSRCPGCGEPVAPRDNLPVLSWLLLRGRCRHCAMPISSRYPLVEIGTAMLFGLMAARFGFDPALPAFLYLSAVGLALAVIDLDHKRLPFALTIPSYPVALVLLTGAALAAGHPDRLIRMLAGMLSLFAFYFVLNLVNPRGMGFGDVMLSGILGVYLGFLGWGPLLVGAFLGFLFGALGGLLFIALGRGSRKSHIPFGPYMLTGTLVAILAGRALAGAYVHATLG
ncbi:MAG: prepilin peptidase [Pseudonocardiales bacterium]|nr:MAG: prepilin peptidase [Pseudonocardiales bacterium]